MNLNLNVKQLTDKQKRVIQIAEAVVSMLILIFTIIAIVSFVSANRNMELHESASTYEQQTHDYESKAFNNRVCGTIFVVFDILAIAFMGATTYALHLNKKTETMPHEIPHLYLAGGWFNPEQEEEHTRLANLLKDFKVQVFNPRVEGTFKPANDNDNMTNVLKSNIAALKDADVVLVITDYKDMGTLWESGFAYANDKPIIYYCETLGNRPFNLMLAKTGYVAKSEDELNALLQNVSTLKFEPYRQYNGEIE